MAPKQDPRLKKNQPAPASSSFLGGARKKEASAPTPGTTSSKAIPEVRREKRQLSSSCEKLASTSKKTKDDAAYDPREAAVPLLSSFRQGRAGSPSGSSVTTLDADPQESDTDVEPVPETPAVGEATHKLRMLGKPEVCTDLETETFRF
jgi:hypothetical protein